MIARVTTFQFKSDRMDEAIDILKKSIVPAAKAQKGYKGLNFYLKKMLLPMKRATITRINSSSSCICMQSHLHGKDMKSSSKTEDHV